ncbi:MAG: HAMP domain-containing histidine kinase [Myxococcales bacterium]|nr:HAMP domain-containing histidine kinase [Myxococcales bacterium]
MTLRTRVTAAIVGPLVTLLVLVLLLQTRSVLAQRTQDVDDDLQTRAAALAGHIAHGEDGWIVDFEGGPGPAPEVTRDLLAWQVRVHPDGRVLEEHAPELLGKIVGLPDPTGEPGTWTRPVRVGGLQVVDRTVGDHATRAWTGLFLARVERGEEEMVRGLPPDLASPPTLQITVVRDLAPVRARTRALLGQIVLLGTLGTLAAFAIAQVLAGRLVRPLNDLARDAEAVRLPLDAAPLAPSNNGDEVDRLAHTLNHAFQRAQDSYARQARFTSDASHELRTPLSVIRSEVEVALRLGVADLTTREAFESVLHQVERMQGTLDQLLCLARADRDGARTAGSVDLADVVRETVDTVRALSPAPPVALDVPDTLTVPADPAAVGMIVRNLLDNALRHTPSTGTVRVSLAVDGDSVRIRVEDDGEGIPAEHVAHVFERFHQVDPSRTGASAGLGLAIVETLAKVHGGTVHLDSEPGRGTCVEVRLPL